uniref:acyltransferase family protein n=1 Tax=Methylobacterium sp. TaxID=409 RepID=UPI0020C8EC4B|nr:acyltransferase [Methylobacterium sp.]USU34671.1 acyltransferase [Methylobacterium sp.]
MLHNVTLVRLISTYILVTYHARAILFALGLGDAEFESMRAGTDLFIVCSAFLTTHVNSRKPISAWDFLRKRLVRIVPLYWVMTFAVFLLVLIAPHIASSTKSDTGELMMSLFFIPYMKESHLVQPIVFVAWTLNLIMLFSLIYALSIALVGIKRAWMAAMVMVCVLVACGEAFSPKSVALEFYSDPLLVEFLFGLAISRFSGTLLSSPPPGRGRSLGIALCCGIAALALAAIVARPHLWPDLHRTFAYGVPCAALLCVAIRLDAHGVSARAPVLQTLAGYAYAIYLSHFFATGFFGLILVKYSPATPPFAFAFLLLTLVTATLVGVLLNHLVEQPLFALFDRSGLTFRERIDTAIGRPLLVAADRLRGGGLTRRAGRP